MENFAHDLRHSVRILLKNPSFTLVEGSIADPDAALRAVAGATWVFHLAAIPSVPLSVAEPERTSATAHDGPITARLP